MERNNEAMSQSAGHNGLLSDGTTPWNGLADRVQFIKSANTPGRRLGGTPRRRSKEVVLAFHHYFRKNMALEHGGQWGLLRG